MESLFLVLIAIVPLWFTLIDSFLKTEIKSAVSMSTDVSVAVTSGQTFLSRKENLTTVARVFLVSKFLYPECFIT